MYIYIWDILVLIWLIVFLVRGASRGLINTLGSLCVTILSFAAGYGLAVTYGMDLAQLLAQGMSAESIDLAYILSECILFFVGYLIVRLVGRWLLRLLNKLGDLPILKVLNWLGGAVFGLLRGAILLLIVGQILLFAGLTPTAEVLSQTVLAKYFLAGFL